MTRRTIRFVSALFLIAGLMGVAQPARADMEWRILEQQDLKAAPLDVATSPDGVRLFVLTPGEILVHSFKDGKIVGKFTVDKAFDRITPLPKGNGIVISSSANKSFQVLTFDMVFPIDTSGSPFKGREDAPVTVVVFDDYQ